MKRMVLLVSAILPLAAQTKVSIRAQGRDFDLSGASSSRPIPVVTSLPGQCLVGQMAFRSDTPAGQNLYACTESGVWTQQGGQGGAATGFRAVRSSDSELTIGSDCSVSSPCLARGGSLVYRRMAPATLRVTSGQGQAFVYIDQTGELTAGGDSAGLVLNCTGCRVETLLTGFPETALPLWTWTATSPPTGGAGLWDVNGGTDQRATLAVGRRFLPGPNVTITESGGTVTIGAASAALPGGTVAGNTSLRVGGAVPASSTEALLAAGAELQAGSAAGTYLGINTAAGFTGDLAHWQVGNDPRFRWQPDGTFLATRAGQDVTWWGNAATAAGSNFRLALGAATGGAMRFGAASRDSLTVTAEGKVSVGTTAPAATTADLLVRDATAGTGDTQVQIQAGAGQSRDLLQFADSGGAVRTRVTKEAALVLSPAGTKPACAVAWRGALWFTAGATGQADVLEVCRKSAADVYAWVTLP